MSKPVSKSASNRSFGITIGLAIILIAAWKYRSSASSYPIWTAAGVVLLLLAIWMPRLLRPIKNLWLRLGHLLGRFLSPVLLIIVYGLSIIPIGLLLRVFRKDTLLLKREPKLESYWILRKPPGPSPASLKNQF
jgi:hypothetical protein